MTTPIGSGNGLPRVEGLPTATTTQAPAATPRSGGASSGSGLTDGDPSDPGTTGLDRTAVYALEPTDPSVVGVTGPLGSFVA
jgi:hypothetical protein